MINLMEDLTGKTFGKYSDLKLMRKSAMSAIYRAHHKAEHQEVILKFLYPAPSDMENFRARFEKNMQKITALEHPNLEKIIDWGCEENYSYMVMNPLGSATLWSRMQKPELGCTLQMNWQQAACILTPVAQALAYAHSQGCYHHDLKPDCIVFNENEAPILTGLGFHDLLQATSVADLLGTGVGLGILDYIAPEQALNLPTDGRADIFSLAVIFYELVTGIKPFHAETTVGILSRQIHHPLFDPRRIIPTIPQAVSLFLKRALRRYPKDRFESMQQVAEIMCCFARGEEHLPARLLMRSRQRSFWLFAGVILMALAVIVLALYFSGLFSIPTP